MLSHEQVWAAIDALATRNGLSPSGLARRAGLDPTTFNPSKRVATDGRPRWPSTESLAKILEATGEPLNTFVATMHPETSGLPEVENGVRLLPFSALNDAGTATQFDKNGLPHGQHWERLPFPDPSNKNLFALEVSGDRMLPLYRDGDIIIAAPGSAVRRGDRVVVKPHHDHLAVMQMQRRTQTATEFSSFDQTRNNLVLKHAEIDWIARIVWASQ